jgi:hypothetical protein
MMEYGVTKYMRNQQLRSISMVVVMMMMGVCLAVGCGKKEPAEDSVFDTARDTQNAFAAMKGVMKQPTLTDERVKQTVAAGDLKALLPETLNGFTRLTIEAQRTGMMGMKISSATADYRTPTGGNIHVTLTDMGTMRGLGSIMTDMEIDKETTNGYEKTMTFKGYSGLEKYNRSTRQGELNLMVGGGRFSVQVTGTVDDASVYRDVVSGIDLKTLDSWTQVGIE